MAAIARDITQLVGRTPLVSINRIGAGLPGRLVAKLESFNPCSSVKDRIGLAMIEAASEPGGFSRTPSSSNRRAATRASASRSSPPSASTHRARHAGDDEPRAAQDAAGLRAQLVLTPGAEGMPGAIRKVGEMAASDPRYLVLQQFANPANPDVHRRTTAEEIWADTDGQIDILVAGVGTGGTVTGIGQVIRPRKPTFRIVAVEPRDSAVLSGSKPGPHKIQGIGAGFVPDVLDRKVIDEVMPVSNEDAGAHGAPPGARGRHHRRHLVRRGHARRCGGRASRRESGQTDRRRAAGLRGALSQHLAVRGDRMTNNENPVAPATPTPPGGREGALARVVDRLCAAHDGLARVG